MHFRALVSAIVESALQYVQVQTSSRPIRHDGHEFGGMAPWPSESATAFIHMENNDSLSSGL